MRRCTSALHGRLLACYFVRSKLGARACSRIAVLCFCKHLAGQGVPVHVSELKQKSRCVIVALLMRVCQIDLLGCCACPQ